MVGDLIRTRTSRSAAPGPDGLRSTLWRKVSGLALEHAANLYTSSLKEGCFPRKWKSAMLVLIPKGAITDGVELKARPICLLDEAGKTLERIMEVRLLDWLDSREPVAGLSPNQFGFRRHKSTVDALTRVKNITSEALDGGGYAIAVSLDIANAFNSIPWGMILGALEVGGAPVYLRRMVASYLSDRFIVFRDPDGVLTERAVRAGVPQGSVLGPLLWNIAFDSVLRLHSEEGCHVICYADDTLVISTASGLPEVITRANIQVARVVNHIRRLGLTIADNKTEAVLFYKRKPRAMPYIRVGDSQIRTRPSIKYLGVMIDAKWSFRDHFTYVCEKLRRVSGALGRLMPNLRGPGERKRRLYANTLTSVAMYAAPVWGRTFAESPLRVVRPWRAIQRNIAIRVIAAYRTVSFDAATLLARMPPWVLEAATRARVHIRVSELRARGDETFEAIAEIRREEGVSLIRQWDILLDSPGAWGQRTLDAVRPHLRRWLDRAHGETNYHTTQLLTGHGSFGRYLWRMGKRPTAECFHCQHAEDDLDHTITRCPAWDTPRLEMSRIMEFPRAPTLRDIVGRILSSEAEWSAFMDFATTVVRAKGEEERRRERDADSPPPSGVP